MWRKREKGTTPSQPHRAVHVLAGHPLADPRSRLSRTPPRNHEILQKKKSRERCGIDIRTQWEQGTSPPLNDECERETEEYHTCDIS